MSSLNLRMKVNHSKVCLEVLQGLKRCRGLAETHSAEANSPHAQELSEGTKAAAETLTCDVFDELCDGRVVGQGAPCRLHVGQLRDKLLDLPDSFRVVPFLGKNQARPSSGLLAHIPCPVLHSPIQLKKPVRLRQMGRALSALPARPTPAL